MLVRYNCKPGIRQRLDKSPTYYGIESIADKRTTYIATYDDFAIVRDGDAIRCDIKEMLTLANMFVRPIKDEILALYDDIKDLYRMEVGLVDQA